MGADIAVIWGQILTATGSKVWILNRVYSGLPTPSNYMEQPTLSVTSGAVTAAITSPSERDILIEPGHYVDEYRQFHFASGAVVNQYDYIKIDGTSDYYVATENCTWYVDGIIPKERVLGRRIKTS